MRRVWAVVAAVAVAIGGVTAVAGLSRADSAEAGAEPKLELVRPTGKYPVGLSQLHLVDTDRADPWVPDRDRELMVSVWYPAKRDGGRSSRYLTEAESRLFLEGEDVDVPGDILAGVKTWSHPDAEPVRGRKRPLVVLSPGGNKPRATLSGIAEQLASDGYVVAVIGHTYETVTEFPDGRVTTCEACDSPDLDQAVRVRSADAAFVLDRLTARHPAWRYGGKLIDRHRIAMAGHSRGGAAAYTTMVADDRVKAAINIDGSMRDPARTGYDKPLLLLGNQYSVPSRDTTWDDEWRLGSGWKRWITMSGTVHASFTDIGLFTAQAGIADPEQTIDAKRCVALTRELVGAFFDRHLSGRQRPVLEGPTDANPELTFHEP